MIKEIENTQTFFSKFRVLIFPVIVLVLVSILGTIAYFYYTEAKCGVGNVTITNLTSSSFTLFWETETPAKSVVFYGESNLFSPLFPGLFKKIAYDERDMQQIELNVEKIKDGGLKNRYTHFVTLKNLKPETIYYVRIGNGFVKPFQYSKKGEIMPEVKTLAVIEKLLAPDPVYGKVVDQDGKAITDAIVSLQLVRKDEVLSTTVSAPVTESGTFSLDIANVKYLFFEDPTIAEKYKDKLFDQVILDSEFIYVIGGPNYEVTSGRIAIDNDQPTQNFVLNKK